MFKCGIWNLDWWCQIIGYVNRFTGWCSMACTSYMEWTRLMYNNLIQLVQIAIWKEREETWWWRERDNQPQKGWGASTATKQNHSMKNWAISCWTKCKSGFRNQETYLSAPGHGNKNGRRRQNKANLRTQMAAENAKVASLNRDKIIIDMVIEVAQTTPFSNDPVLRLWDNWLEQQIKLAEMSSQ